MGKFSNAEKQAAIREVKAGDSIADVARRHQMSEEIVSRYLRLTKAHGENIQVKESYYWTAEQKYKVLEYMHENHLSCMETSIQFGISGSSTIWRWEHKYLKNGIEGLENKKPTKKPRIQKPKPPKTREEELLERIEDLEMENEYLKKLNALVAEREKRERGTR